jgi:hypothetical protein
MAAFDDLVPIPPKELLNVNLSSAREDTMLKSFGKPGPLSKNCKPPSGKIVKRLRMGADVGPFKVDGLDYAVESLAQAFAEVQELEPQLFGAVRHEGMLCVRARRNNPSRYSNHSWGTAIDIFFGKKGVVPQGKPLAHRGVLLLAPYLMSRGWYWGAEFSGSSVDTMHFELAEETILKVAKLPL